jgi:3-hydroxybutyrate dehydrogenase
MLAVMLEAPFLLARAALPFMYGQGWGRIVNISSVHGLRASPFKSAYVAAKACPRCWPSRGPSTV